MTPLPEWLDQLLRRTRPGSRSVLVEPSEQLVVEFARRGYRLHLLTRTSETLQALRQRLRELGLGSQLMGGQHGFPEAMSLADDFYELVVVPETETLPGDRVMAALRPGALVFCIGGQLVDPPESLSEVEGLSAPLTAFRFRA